jgi:hypothetical protein
MFIYALPNSGWRALPNTTVYTSSEDGVSWTTMRPIDQPGWLLWRPKTVDGSTWYVTAYWHEHGRSALFRSNEAERWEQVSQIHEGDANDETDFEFLPDGRILATARLEGTRTTSGVTRTGTLIAIAAPPYERWTYARSAVTRLDGRACSRTTAASTPSLATRRRVRSGSSNRVACTAASGRRSSSSKKTDCATSATCRAPATHRTRAS